MSRIEIRSLGVGRCRVVHLDSGAEIRTEVAPELGGGGSEFSSTDLLAAALGSCILSSLDRVAERHGVPLDSLRVLVTKELASRPKRIARLAVEVTVEWPVEAGVLARLERASHACTVHRSLDPALPVEIRLLVGVPGR